MRKALLLLALVAGCDMYWGNGDDDVCNNNNVYEAPPSQGGFIDPSTGQCEYIGGGGGYCNNQCGPCPATGGADIAQPDWPTCNSSCTGLDQTTCEATSGCHADFQAGSYWQCVATAPGGPAEGGACNLFDAQTCSTHDDCITNYSSGDAYQSCAPEDQTYCATDSDCSSGQTCDTSTCYQPNCPPNADCTSVCEGVCVPDAACTNVDCGSGYHCEETCYPCDPTTGQMCPPDGTCSPQCVPDQTCADVDCGPGQMCAMECSSGACYPTCVSTGGGPGDCTGSVTCSSAPPACPANTTAGIANGCYTGYCIPNADCGPHDPGQCYATVSCNIAPPACPMGTLPGVSNGCWSGYCIPTASCEVPACETLTTEAACTARTDCSPVYSGTDCTCTPEGCTCQTLSFERCESALMPL